MIPAIFAQAQANAAGFDPIVSISTGHFRGSLKALDEYFKWRRTAEGEAAVK